MARKGEVLPPRSAEHRQAISDGMRGVCPPPMTEAHRKALSVARTGKKHSQATKDKIATQAKEQHRRRREAEHGTGHSNDCAE